MNTAPKEITNPVKAIRAKCLDCMCGSSNEVERCPCKDCALYPFRRGRNPYRTKREYTEEEKAKLRDQLARARTATLIRTRNGLESIDGGENNA